LLPDRPDLGAIGAADAKSLPDFPNAFDAISRKSTQNLPCIAAHSATKTPRKFTVR
jgi:hypothetical protein